MTTFSVTGPFLGAPASITWTDGHLSGDEDVRGLAEAYVEEGVEVSIAGIWTGTADLSAIEAAYATLVDIFGGKVTKFSGADPFLGWKPLEHGAVT